MCERNPAPEPASSARTTSSAFHVGPYQGPASRPSFPQPLRKRYRRAVHEQRYRVLVVDDQAETTRALRRVLSERYDVETALSGAEGIAKLEAFRPDVIITDLEMPGLDGTALLEEAQRQLPGSIRLLLSGHQPESPGLHLDPRISAFLTKPWRNEDLLATLQRFLVERGRRETQ